MKKFSLLLALALTGCDYGPVTQNMIEAAQSKCANNGSVLEMRSTGSLRCSNGAIFILEAKDLTK